MGHPECVRAGCATVKTSGFTWAADDLTASGVRITLVDETRPRTRFASHSDTRATRRRRRTDGHFRPPERANTCRTRAGCSPFRICTFGADEVSPGINLIPGCDGDDTEALRRRAGRASRSSGSGGISMQDAARRAIRDDVARSAHRSRVAAAAELISDVHADSDRATCSLSVRSSSWTSTTYSSVRES